KPSERTRAAGDVAPRVPRRVSRFWLVLPTVMAMVAGGWVATRIDFFGSPKPNAAHNLSRGELRYDARTPPQPRGLGLLTQPQNAAMLTRDPARRPLDHEPARLPAYPGPEPVEHETRYRLADGPWVDEFSFWRIRGDDPAAVVASVAEHYDAAALRAGFGRFDASGSRPGRPGRTNRLYLDDSGGFRSLSVQILEQTGGCHVTITVRYESPTP
ncbi:MAG: hypothetical protein AAGL98_12030, partial [Planctomycetota bacterium]